ncbi:MAG: hypothetical protein U5K37_05930 [Natrialbaceae archaeon]|nr:hypothetical protein [Natrialbaceae archaeon]
MSTQPSTLGICPRCGETVPAGRLLIEYRRADGPAMYAECPGCRDVIRPE